MTRKYRVIPTLSNYINSSLKNIFRGNSYTYIRLYINFKHCLYMLHIKHPAFQFRSNISCRNKAKNNHLTKTNEFRLKKWKSTLFPLMSITLMQLCIGIMIILNNKVIIHLKIPNVWSMLTKTLYNAPFFSFTSPSMGSVKIYKNCFSLKNKIIPKIYLMWSSTLNHFIT